MHMIRFTSFERKNLLKLLSRAVDPDGVFNLEEIHGFLFGLAITPELIKPSEWLPMVFGEEMMEFKSDKEATELMGHLFKVYNRLTSESHEKKLSFPFDIGDIKKGDLIKISDWAYGLFQSMTLRPEIWSMHDEAKGDTNLTEDERELVSACGIIIAVAEPDYIPEVFEKESFDPETNEKNLNLQATLFALLPSAVATLQAHAEALNEQQQVLMKSNIHRLLQNKPKIGRNDPCPCGTGRKYKKCCGMN